MRVYACDCACIGLCCENIASNNINIIRKKKSLKMWKEEEKEERRRKQQLQANTARTRMLLCIKYYLPLHV